MRTGEGEDGGLRAAPIVPDEAADALANPPDGYADREAPDTAGADSPGNSVTQQLPMVRREGLGEPPGVRAVARRVASALPALGRDEITDAPRSARTTAFRRRRAAAEGRAVPADASPATSNDPALTGHAPGRPYPGEPVADVVEPLSSAESAPAAAVVLIQADRGEELEPIAPVPVAHGMPVSRGGEVTATQLMGQPAARPDEAVLDAEILDDLPSPRSSADAAAAGVLTSLTEVAFREARKDEWIMGQPEPVREPSTLLDPIRPGPAQLESDSWDTGSLPAIKRDAYQGRRRAATAGARLWVVIGLVVTALSTAIAIPFLLGSGSSTPADARTPDGQVSVIDIASPDSDTATSPPALPVVGSSPLITQSPEQSTEQSPTASLIPFVLTIHAEQGGTASAWAGSAGPPQNTSGATVIDEIGRGSDNWLEFQNIVVPDPGQPYVVKIWYVYGVGPPGERQMSVIVNGSTTSTQQFQSTTTLTARDVTVTLGAGNNTIRLAHPTYRCPAIDRIEITRA